jgi:Trypsin-like peptidase domain
MLSNGQWSTLPAGEWELPPKKAKWFPFDPTNCHEDYGTDVAVCKTRQARTAEAVPHEAAAVSTVRPVKSTKVFFVGFGRSAMNASTVIATIASVSGADSKHAMVIDKSAWPGASGSPIFASDGKQIVGMITETGIGDTSGRSFGVTGEAILAILAKVK